MIYRTICSSYKVLISSEISMATHPRKHGTSEVPCYWEMVTISMQTGTPKPRLAICNGPYVNAENESPL